MKSSGQNGTRFKPGELGHFRVLREFRQCLAKVLADRAPEPALGDSRRLLELGDYLGLLLFGLLNPVAGTLRGLCEASRIAKVQRDVCTRPASLGSLSEAQYLADPAVLERVFSELSSELVARGGTSPDLTAKAREIEGWLAHDSSIWPALPRMAWALYGAGRNASAKAVSLNLSFHVGADAPAGASVSEAARCERVSLRGILKPGAAYIGDRYYGINYAFFGELESKGCSYCIRLCDDARTEVIGELPVSEEEAAGGVLRQFTARLGLGNKSAQSCPLRVVHVRGVSGEILVLATNLSRDALSGDAVALLYKQRWNIEYFFRWVKCVMGCGHWMAESREGVTTQIYLALIGSLLLQLQLGKRPSKRVWELLQWHQCGMIGDGELEALLARQIERERRPKKPHPFEELLKRQR